MSHFATQNIMKFRATRVMMSLLQLSSTKYEYEQQQIPIPLRQSIMETEVKSYASKVMFPCVEASKCHQLTLLNLYMNFVLCICLKGKSTYLRMLKISWGWKRRYNTTVMSYIKGHEPTFMENA